MGRLALRLFLLALGVLPVQILLGNLEQHPPMPARDRFDSAVASGPEILLFGDSTLGWTRGEDPRTVPAMLAERLPERRVESAAMGGMDLDLFALYGARLAGAPRRPRVLVIEVNPRSFAPIWDLNPVFERRLERLRLAWGDTLALGLVRPMAVLGLYDRNPRSPEEYAATPVWNDGIAAGSIRDVLKGRGPSSSLSPAARTFLLAYATPIEPGHRKLASLRRLIRRCRAAGIRPLIYVTPLDLETGTRVLGDRFREVVARNLQRIADVAREEGETLADFSALCPAAEFDWKASHAANEHLLSAGRRRLADALANLLR